MQIANANIEKRRKSMNGKRVRMAVMSAVILSALAVSGCSAEGNKLLLLTVSRHHNAVRSKLFKKL